MVNGSAVAATAHVLNLEPFGDRSIRSNPRRNVRSRLAVERISVAIEPSRREVTAKDGIDDAHFALVCVRRYIVIW
jgi:hypothetical protein